MDALFRNADLGFDQIAIIRKAIAGEGTLFCMASWHNEFQINETQATIAGRAVGLPPEFYKAWWQDQGGE